MRNTDLSSTTTVDEIAALSPIAIGAFRHAPGQGIPPHGNAPTVLLTVLSRSGIVVGMDSGSLCGRSSTVADAIASSPHETQSMRAAHGEFLLPATITPRPGSR